MASDFELDTIKYYRTVHPAHNPNFKGFGKRFLRWRGSRKIHKTKTQSSSIGMGSGKKKFKFGFGWLKSKAGLTLRFLNTGVSWVEEKLMFRLFRRRIIEVASAENSEIIHAHTPYRVGIPALYAARKLRLPFVYEMRGMWEETAVGSGRWKSWGPSYRRFRRIETKLLNRADAVICISETLRAEAISRGVDATKITVVHNAVSVHKGDVGATPVADESELLAQATDGLALSEGTVVVGYIGSLRAIEGVEKTVSAVAKLADQGLDVRFFALTSTSGQAELRRYCSEQGIADKSVIAGPVPHQQVEPFYQLIDIFVVSRPKTRVTSLVTPLKPFEAMMAGIAVICSDLPALAEIVDDGKTGLLYSVDDIDDLSSKISRLVNDSELRQRLGHAAKNWVEAERTWEVVVERGLAAYVIAQAGNPLR